VSLFIVCLYSFCVFVHSVSLFILCLGLISGPGLVPTRTWGCISGDIKNKRYIHKYTDTRCAEVIKLILFPIQVQTSKWNVSLQSKFTHKWSIQSDRAKTRKNCHTDYTHRVLSVISLALQRICVPCTPTHHKCYNCVCDQEIWNLFGRCRTKWASIRQRAVLICCLIKPCFIINKPFWTSNGYYVYLSSTEVLFCHIRHTSLKDMTIYGTVK